MIVKVVSKQNYLEFWENLTHPLVVKKIIQKTLIKLQPERKAHSIFELWLNLGEFININFVGARND